MARKPPPPPAPPAERSRLRAAVLAAGAQLGWPPHDVIRFAEALTGCSWPRCGCAELDAVLGEYESLLDVIATKTGRPDRHEP